jgi:hypothetical protein
MWPRQQAVAEAEAEAEAGQLTQLDSDVSIDRGGYSRRMRADQDGTGLLAQIRRISPEKFADLLRSNLPRGGYPWQALAAVAEQRHR